MLAGKREIRLDLAGSGDIQTSTPRFLEPVSRELSIGTLGIEIRRRRKFSGDRIPATPNRQLLIDCRGRRTESNDTDLVFFSLLENLL